MNLNNIKKAWNCLLSDWEKRHRLPGLVGINFSDDGFAWAYAITNVTGKPKIQACDFVPCTEKDLAQKLAETVNLRQLKDISCSWVLNRSDYHLLLIDMPSVPEEELQDAIQWLIKDLIDFPVRDAVIDFLDIPEAIAKNPKKMFVVITQKNKLQEKASLISASGLHLTSIDINTLALRNLGMALANGQEDFALLHLEKNSCSMIVLSKLFLCLVRQINVTLAEFDQAGIRTEAIEENLLEEIKRTIDYCSEQMVNITPNKIFILPVEEQYTKVTRYLSKELPGELPGIIQEVDFNAVFEIVPNIDQKILARCSIALCGALRQEEIM